jgi:hypothetical protein
MIQRIFENFYIKICGKKTFYFQLIRKIDLENFSQRKKNDKNSIIRNSHDLLSTIGEIENSGYKG